jgi:glutamate N-acetyltransferase/amino-acid N-acetyltransferase
LYKLEKLESGVCAAAGFFADGVSAGLKPDGAKDMAFIYTLAPSGFSPALTPSAKNPAAAHTPLSSFSNLYKF